MTATSPLLDPSTFSAEAQRRLRKPLRRGAFRDIDAARSQFGLLTVADTGGQARIYWLVDLNTHVIEDARFLAFGSLASHPVADVWTERIRGLSVEAACAMPLEEIEALLRERPAVPAFGEAGLEPLNFVAELQDLALVALPQVRLLPKPVEVERYQRKREQDWDEHDRAWLPLTLMKKIMQAQDAIGPALRERLGRDISWTVEGLHDDFRLVVAFTGSHAPPADERPTILAFMQEAAHAALHPAIVVEEKAPGRET